MNNNQITKMTSQDIREAFIKFFTDRGHAPIQRSSLIPHNDPTLLFVNSGMVQFKDVFLGTDKRPYSRATTVQPSVRAGGKHNDLDNVGYTARHHTFFEMLGNFSFGDYFKKDAIYFAWEFLTKILNLPKEKLWVTVYEKDDEAANIWINEIGVNPERLSRIGAKDNFWQMGDTGPCGPCTEIFYDHGESVWGGPPGSEEADGDRYIEIWNLVFMQYERDSAGNLHPLPKPSVDTGMGLERLAAILQGVHDNYDIDTFVYLIKATAEILNIQNLQEKSLRVIADHIRSTGFLITDGVMPSNEGRGYVLRRIIRRAIRHGEKLGAKEVFFYKLVQPLVEIMGKAYPELKANQNIISEVLEKEEIQFLKTLEHGLKLFNEETKSIKNLNNQDLNNQAVNKQVPGEIVFKLYDTYGFPVDLTQDLARERGWSLDMAGFDQAMEAQRARARSAGSFKEAYQSPVGLNQKSEFLGYEQLDSESLVTAIYLNGESINTLEAKEPNQANQKAQIVLDRTPFYGESGGQVGDVGVLVFKDKENQTIFEFIVEDTQKQGEAILHLGYLKSGVLKLNQKILAHVNPETRALTRLNHSATHLLDAALIKILGPHILQKGSQVRPDRLRFDFSHPKALSPEEIKKIEDLVNQEILKNLEVNTVMTDQESAKKLGAIALFGEKYGEIVRVVKMGEFSTEFCGGTHVSRTGDIGIFKIISQSSVAAGIRRIEAITGPAVLTYLQNLEKNQNELASLLKISGDKILDKVADLMQKTKTLSANKSANKPSFAQQNFQEKIKLIKEVNFIYLDMPGMDIKFLKEKIDELKTKFEKSVIFLSSILDNKITLVIGVTDNLTSKIKAGDLIANIAPSVGGRGGGRADLAQAGGTQPENLPKAIEGAENWLREYL